MIQHSPCGYMLKRIESRVSRRSAYAHVYSCVTHNSREGESDLSDTGQMNVWQTGTTAHHSALRSQDILTHALTGRNLEDITLSEIGQSQKDK